MKALGRIVAVVAAIGTLATALWPNRVDGQERLELQGLSCIGVEVALIDGAAPAITGFDLRNELVVRLRARLAQLRLDPRCDNRLALWTFVQHLSDDRTDWAYVHMELRLLPPRPAARHVGADHARRLALEPPLLPRHA